MTVHANQPDADFAIRQSLQALEILQILETHRTGNYPPLHTWLVTIAFRSTLRALQALLDRLEAGEFVRN